MFLKRGIFHVREGKLDVRLVELVGQVAHVQIVGFGFMFLLLFWMSSPAICPNNFCPSSAVPSNSKSGTKKWSQAQKVRLKVVFCEFVVNQR